MYSLAICEDNEKERENLKQICEMILGEEDIPGTISCFSDADKLEQAMEAGQIFDLLLLDIEMEGRNGMEFARQLRKKGNRVSIIFTTGQEDYLREGYSVQPINYLLKPISQTSLAEAIRTDRNLNHTQKILTLHCGARTVVFNASDIYYVESSGRGVVVYEKEGNRALPLTMKKVTELFPKDKFCRCHNGFLVNMEHISEIMRTEILLNNGVQIPVGRIFYSDTQKAFIRYLNYGAL